MSRVPTAALAAALMLGCPASPDDPTSFTVATDVASVLEDAGIADGVAVVTLDAPAVDTVDVWVETSDEARVKPTQHPFQIAPDEDEVTIGLEVIDDAFVGPDFTVTVTVDALDGPTRSFDLKVVDDEPHTLALTGPGSVSEGAGTVQLTLTAAADLATPVTVSLTVDPVGALSFDPVTLAAGTDAVVATGTVADDTLLDFDRWVGVEATADTLLEEANIQIMVTDDEPAALTLEAVATEVHEFDGTIAVGARVHSAAPPAANLVVGLTSADATVLDVPAQVVILAETTTVDVPYIVLDDAVVDGDIAVMLYANAMDLTGDQLQVVVEDDEFVNLQLSLQSTFVGEWAGVLTDFATLSTGNEMAYDLVIDVAADDPSELTVPATVTVPAGSAGAQFDVTAVDDLWLDFDHVVTIEITDGDGVDTALLTVRDDESPALLLALYDDAVEEGAEPGSAAVQTSAPVEEALEIDLVSADTGQLQVPNSVWIGPGDDEVAFPFTAVDDPDPDFDQWVEVTASCDGCLDGVAGVRVLDDESGYAVEIMGPSIADEVWVEFPALPGFMAGTDWAIAEKFAVPDGAEQWGYQWMRGSAFYDLSGDVTVMFSLMDVDGGVSEWVPSAWVLPGGVFGMDPTGPGPQITEGSGWHTVVVQHDHDLALSYLYVDGVLVSQLAVGAVDDSANTNPLAWGGQWAVPELEIGDLYNETDTTIAHMAWLQRLMTTEEIEAYDGSVDLDDPALVFATAIGRDGVLDVSGGERDGTVHGDPVFYRP